MADEITQWIHWQTSAQDTHSSIPAHPARTPVLGLPHQPEIADSSPLEESGPDSSRGQLKPSTSHRYTQVSRLPTSALHLFLQFFLPAASNCPFRAPNVSSVAFNLSWELPGSLPLISIPVSVPHSPESLSPEPSLAPPPTSLVEEHSIRWIGIDIKHT